MECDISIEEPSIHEIKIELKQVKNRKSPSKDCMPPEILIADVNTMAHILYPVFQEIWRSEEIPADWKNGLIVKIPKKGDKTKCKNWRGIFLFSIPSKVFSRIILNRLEAALDPYIRREQAGFRKNRSCIDQINTL